jgi:hypothetical protein
LRLIVCLFVCVVGHGVNEEGPDCDQANEDQFRDSEPEGQCYDQDLPQEFDDGKFNSAL